MQEINKEFDPKAVKIPASMCHSLVDDTGACISSETFATRYGGESISSERVLDHASMRSITAKLSNGRVYPTQLPTSSTDLRHHESRRLRVLRLAALMASKMKWDDLSRIERHKHAVYGQGVMHKRKSRGVLG